jgi:hypothetical protein
MSNEVLLKVEYIVDRDDMTEEEYQEQEEADGLLRHPDEEHAF